MLGEFDRQAAHVLLMTGGLQTVGTELSVLDVKLSDSDLDLRLHALDTGGHPAQLKLMQDSVGTSHNFCCLVYSVVDKDTFASIKSWYSMMTARASRQGTKLQGLLIGNKMDLPAGTHQVVTYTHSLELRPHVQCQPF